MMRTSSRLMSATMGSPSAPARFMVNLTSSQRTLRGCAMQKARALTSSPTKDMTSRKSRYWRRASSPSFTTMGGRSGSGLSGSRCSDSRSIRHSRPWSFSDTPRSSKGIPLDRERFSISIRASAPALSRYSTPETSTAIFRGSRRPGMACRSAMRGLRSARARRPASRTVASAPRAPSMLILYPALLIADMAPVPGGTQRPKSTRRNSSSVSP